MRLLCLLAVVMLAWAGDDGPTARVGLELRLNEAGWEVPPPRSRTLYGQAASVGNDLLVVYRGLEPGIGGVKLFVRLVSAGEVGPPVSLTGEERGAYGSPAIIADQAGVVHVTWLEVLRRGNNSLCYRRSRDGGATWDPVRRFPAGASRARPILRGGEGGELYIAFSSTMEGRGAEAVYLFSSADGGETWRESDVNPPADWGSGQSPGVAVGAEGRVAVAWGNQTPGRISAVFNRSTDRGRTWLSEPMVVSDDRSVRISEPAVVHSGGRYLVFWLDKAGTRHRVWMDSSPDGDLAWEGNRLLLEVDADRFEWEIVGEGARVYLVWLEGVRRGPLQTESSGILPIVTSEVAVGSAKPMRFPSELGESRILGLSAAEVEGILYLSSLTYDADRRYRRRLDRFEGSGGAVRLLEEILPDRMDRSHWTLIPHGGETVLLFRESPVRNLPHESALRGNLKLVQFVLDRRR